MLVQVARTLYGCEVPEGGMALLPAGNALRSDLDNQGEGQIHIPSTLVSGSLNPKPQFFLFLWAIILGTSPYNVA